MYTISYLFLSLYIPLVIQTFLHFPKMASAQANRDYIISGMMEALVTIAELADGKDPANTPFFLAVGEGPSGVYQYFDDFEVSIYV